MGPRRSVVAVTFLPHCLAQPAWGLAQRTHRELMLELTWTAPLSPSLSMTEPSTSSTSPMLTRWIRSGPTVLGRVFLGGSEVHAGAPGLA